MGVIIKSKNHCIDIRSINNLRLKISELMGREIFEHYKNLENGWLISGKEKEKFFEEYNKRTFDIREKYNVPDGIIQFLYADRGSISPEDCAQIWEVIKDYDDKILYGYPRLPFCARFKDIKEVIRDCIENHCKLKWF